MVRAFLTEVEKELAELQERALAHA
jgi:hypothetical protein